MTKEKKLILLDLDDTLWDTWSNNKESLEELYTALAWGQYFSSFESFFETYYFPINHQLWSLYNKEEISKEELCTRRLSEPLYKRLAELDLAELDQPWSQDADYWTKANADFMQRIVQKTKLVTGARRLLEYLSCKYRLAILSNGFPEVQYAKLENSHLAPFVEQVFLSDEIGYNKPNPKIFEYALEKMQVQKEDTLMIGDSWASDVSGALASGLEVIWYNPYEQEVPCKPTPRGLVASVQLLQDIESFI